MLSNCFPMLVREMVIRDVNHPCIFAWCNGNEGGSNFTVDDAVAIHRDVEGLSAVAPAVSRSAVAVAGNRNRTTQVTGASWPAPQNHFPAPSRARGDQPVEMVEEARTERVTLLTLGRTIR